MRLHNLARALQERHEELGGAEDRDRAVAMYRSIWSRDADQGKWALAAGVAWGVWSSSRGSWTEAAEAYGHGLRAMERLFRAQAGREDKENWLRAARLVPAGAAYARTAAGDAAGAAVALESGRALLLTEALERSGAALHGLAERGHADLVAAYRRAASRATALQEPGEPVVGTPLGSRPGRPALAVFASTTARQQAEEEFETAPRRSGASPASNVSWTRPAWRTWTRSPRPCRSSPSPSPPAGGTALVAEGRGRGDPSPAAPAYRGCRPRPGRSDARRLRRSF